MASGSNSPSKFIRLSDDPANQMSVDVRTPNRVNSYLVSQTNPAKRIDFLSLNPSQVQFTNSPVQGVYPTAGGFHVYRWMNLPNQWVISGYAGLQGRNLAQQIEAFIGEVNARWHWPYLGPDRFVRIDDIQMPKNASNPFSIYYQINMQELTPFLNQSLIASIIPNRITPGFTSPNTTAIQNILNATSIGSTPVLPTWTSMNDAAAFVYQQHLTQLQLTDLLDPNTGMRALNNNPIEPWAPGAPVDPTTGQVIKDLKFPLNTINKN